MKRRLLTLIFLNFFVLNFIKLAGQENQDSLTLFVNENTEIINEQIKHIRDIFYGFNENESKYIRKLLVFSLRDRNEMFLVSPKNLKLIGSEAQSDWINIYTYNSDTFCCELDYFEYYFTNLNNEFHKITCIQGDYPDGFFSESTDYYFDNNRLVFAFSKSESFPPYVSEYKSSEERYYFLNDKPIRCLRKINNGENVNIELSNGIPILQKGNELIVKTKKFKILK